jgi:hypothetical protein
MATRWMSAAESLAYVSRRLGGCVPAAAYAFLLPALHDGRIPARAEFFTHAESGRELHRQDKIIPLDWWDPDENPQHVSSSRFRFKRYIMENCADEIEAHGVEFDVDAVKASPFPFQPPPEVAPEPPAAEPVKADPPPPKPQGRKHGRVGYDIWPDMHEYLASVVTDTGKKFTSYRKVGEAGYAWAKEQQGNRRKLKKGAAVPSADTIRERASKLWSDLVEDNGG